MLLTTNCAVCGSDASTRCSGCFSVAYCKTDCQKPFAVKESKKVGRYMVATRDLKAGEIILREKAAVVGPSLEQSKAVCLGCSASLQKTWHLCQVCQGPLCSKQCEKRPLHVEECKVLKINKE